jgi:TusA-related sulfurtransferase
MTWVRVKLVLEELAPGETVEVLLQGAEPLRNVPRNISDEGHLVRDTTTLADGRTRLLVEVRGTN